MLKRKLQVFVSSTFKDLQQERQAAVAAILSAGHIPAGMELFASGDESQMAVIKRWIDESDVYMLILGGCYGTVEPKSKKSYTQLEYEYALDTGKPLFAVVGNQKALEERGRSLGLDFIERQENKKLAAFRKKVLDNISSFWDDTKDIKIKTGDSLREFDRRADLVGWVPGNEAATPATANELSRLSSENAELRKKVADLDTSPTSILAKFSSFLKRSLLLEHNFSVGGMRPNNEGGMEFGVRLSLKGACNVTFATILRALGKSLLFSPNEGQLKSDYNSMLVLASGSDLIVGEQVHETGSLLHPDWKELAVQLVISAVIEPLEGEAHVHRMWRVTEPGKHLIAALLQDQEGQC